MIDDPKYTSSSHKARSLAFRNDVLLYLHEAGFLGVQRRREHKKISTALRDRLNTGDLIGLPWTIATRNEKNMDLSGALREAEREAATAGQELFAHIQRRRGHGVEDAYVTMPLKVFVSVMKQLHPEHVLPAGSGSS